MKEPTYSFVENKLLLLPETQQMERRKVTGLGVKLVEDLMGCFVLMRQLLGAGKGKPH